jgi:hypothetical protein
MSQVNASALDDHRLQTRSWAGDFLWKSFQRWKERKKKQKRKKGEARGK